MRGLGLACSVRDMAVDENYLTPEMHLSPKSNFFRGTYIIRIGIGATCSINTKMIEGARLDLRPIDYTYTTQDKSITNHMASPRSEGNVAPESTFRPLNPKP